MKKAKNTYDNIIYEKCNNKIKYSMKHKTKPIELSSEMTKVIEYLLWYVPNISSYQSPDNELLNSLAFDDFVFGIVKQVMNLTNKDVFFLDSIPVDVVDYYLESICPDNEKLILTKGEGESKTNSLLRHVRNSIAHGYFNLVEDLFVGFDFLNDANNKDQCSAIMKIRPGTLLEALEKIDSEVTAEQLALISLQRTGYRVEKFRSKGNGYDFDFFVEKDNNKFALEIKKYRNVEVLSQEEVNKLVENFTNSAPNLIPILFINTSLLTKKSKNRLKNEEIVILDISNIQEMLDGRDILKEIVSLNK